MADAISRFSRSIELIQASGRVLRSDKELIVLPLISGVVSLIVGWAFIAPLLGNPELMNAANEDSTNLPMWFYGWLFAFYFVEYLIIIFFNTALVAAAIARLSGADPTVASALSLAAARIVPIVGYALVSATLGVVLRAIAEKLGFVGRLIEGVFGLAWTVATFLVVPVLAAEGVGPVKAIRRSTELLGETWGENLIGNAGISVVTSLLGVVVFIATIGVGMFAVSNGNLAAGVPLIVVGGALMIAIILISSALTGIYSGAVYYFALTGDAPAGFDKSLISGAFTRKDT